jgi:hypothetical protein
VTGEFIWADRAGRLRCHLSEGGREPRRDAHYLLIIGDQPRARLLGHDNVRGVVGREPARGPARDGVDVGSISSKPRLDSDCASCSSLVCVQAQRRAATFTISSHSSSGAGN